MTGITGEAAERIPCKQESLCTFAGDVCASGFLQWARSPYSLLCGLQLTPSESVLVGVAMTAPGGQSLNAALIAVLICARLFHLLPTVADIAKMSMAIT